MSTPSSGPSHRKRWRKFLSFLKSLRRRWPGERLHVVLDNYSPHRHPAVTESADGTAADGSPAAELACPDGLSLLGAHASAGHDDGGALITGPAEDLGITALRADADLKSLSPCPRPAYRASAPTGA